MQELDLKTLDRYSYSKISTYKQCKFKFKLKYLDKNFIFNATISHIKSNKIKKIFILTL